METNTKLRPSYEANLNGLKKALADLDKAEKKVMAYRRTLTSLARICKETGENIADLEQKYASLNKHIEGSLTDEIRKIIKANPDPVTTQDVAHALRMLNYDISTNKNPLATINAILNRLADSKEVKEVTVGTRKAWKRMMPFYGEY